MKTTTTINISPKELEVIIQDYIKQKRPDIQFESVKYNVNPHSTGYGTSGYTDYTFDGVDVKVKMEI